MSPWWHVKLGHSLMQFISFISCCLGFTVFILNIHQICMIIWWIVNKHFYQNCTCVSVTKTRLYGFDPLKPHFYTVKLGFTGVYINFPISAEKHRLWVLVRTASPRRQSMFWVEIISKTRLYNFDPIKPHFYIVKLGLTGYTLFFLFLLKT